jgi:sulfite reductase (NADPH) hemoprotein beta-component
MAVTDDVRTLGRGRPSFANERDIDEFVDVLSRYENGDISADDWRRFRLLRGTYGQRQDGVQMMRIKIPQGIVTGDQLRALGDVAAKYSRGFGHVTTRQNIQYHFVLLKDAELAMRDLAEVGMTTREACGNSVRNITACPYAGIAHDELFDVTPYAEGMTRYFLGHPLAGSLPRKFKIAFEGCPHDHALASIHDLGWFARTSDGRRGFRLTIAGGTSILPTSGYLLYEFLPAEQMLEVAEAIVRVYHRLGDYKHPQRNRMKFLIRQLGWDAWRQKFDETLAEVRAEGGVPFNASAAASDVEQAPDWPAPPAPSLEEVKRTAASVDVHGPGIMPGTVKLQTVSDAYLGWMQTNVGLQRQAGFVHVTVRLPLGDMTAGQMHVLADLAEAYADGTARLTIGQNVLFRWVKVGAIQELYQRLQAAGLGAAGANTIADVVSCPGAESCRLAVTQSRGLGRILTEYLDRHPEFVALVQEGDI